MTSLQNLLLALVILFVLLNLVARLGSSRDCFLVPHFDEGFSVSEIQPDPDPPAGGMVWVWASNTALGIETRNDNLFDYTFRFRVT